MMRHTLTSCAALAVLMNRPKYGYGVGLAQVTGLPVNRAYKSLYRLKRAGFAKVLSTHATETSDEFILYALTQPKGCNETLQLMQEMRAILEPLGSMPVGNGPLPELRYVSLVELAIWAVLLARTSSTAAIIANFAGHRTMSVKRALQRFEKADLVKQVGYHHNSPIFQIMPNANEPAWLTVRTAYFVLELAGM